MTSYVALLRGINVSGKNKISMSELKAGFEAIGFSGVRTYLNSGNVSFLSDSNDITDIRSNIELMLKDRFDMKISVFTMTLEELVDILNHAPTWWGTDQKDIYDNLIFIIPPTTFNEVFDILGEPKTEYEKISNYNQVIFWSFSRKDYTKTNWWSKTAGESIKDQITIRTANTLRKIVEKCNT